MSIPKHTGGFDAASAEILALRAATFIAGDDVLLTRFLALSGLDLDTFRGMVGRIEGQLAVLDFLMGHEPDLVAFASQSEIRPEAVIRARKMLDPEGIPE